MLYIRLLDHGFAVPSDAVVNNQGMATLPAALLTQPTTSTRKPRRGGPKPTTNTGITTVKLSAADRSLLEHLAELENASFADIWRRSLHAYAQELGLEGPGDQEARAA